jgi:nifR3 family TIM-barrel protein
MVRAGGWQGSESTPRIACVSGDSSPIGIQLFDSCPQYLADAARKAEAEGADAIDINMGCPVNKITRRGGGSSLLREPATAAAIVEAVAGAVAVPVTVKTRLGWCGQSVSILEFARQLQDTGAQMLTLHGRTRAQGFSRQADWDWIAKVKAELAIPVIANGDVMSVDSAIACLAQTGADGVMCARGTLGNPWLVGEIDRYLQTGKVPIPLTPAERLQVAQDHAQALWEDKGYAGILQARKHMDWYVSEMPKIAALRPQLCRLCRLCSREYVKQDSEWFDSDECEKQPNKSISFR